MSESPVSTPPPPPPAPPPNRLYQAAAWVVIVAGTVFVAAVIFGTGVYLSGGGWHGHHRHGPCMMHHGPPMGPDFGPGGPGFGPAGPGAEPHWPGPRSAGPGNGPGGPGGPRAGGPMAMFGQAMPLSDFIAKRTQSVAAQLEGKSKGYIPQGGFGPMMMRIQPGQVLPPFMQDRLQLSAEQRKKLEELQKEVDAKLGVILTDEQRKRMKEMP